LLAKPGWAVATIKLLGMLPGQVLSSAAFLARNQNIADDLDHFLILLRVWVIAQACQDKRQGKLVSID
jgi:hypothetical protein